MAGHNHIVYMLTCNDDTFYTGYTTDLERCVQRHMDGEEANYTRGRGPFQVVFVEKHETKEAALKRERKIKQFSRKEKALLIREQLKDVIRHANSEEF